MFSDDYENARIEEYEDNLIVDIPLFFVQVDEKKNDITVTIEDNFFGDKLNKPEKVKYGYYVYVQAKDAEHAKKIAYDLIAEHKAKKGGIA